MKSGKLSCVKDGINLICYKTGTARDQNGANDCKGQLIAIFAVTQKPVLYERSFDKSKILNMDNENTSWTGTINYVKSLWNNKLC